MRRLCRGAGALLLIAAAGGAEAQPQRFEPMDVFGLELAADPRIAPDGSVVVYVRQVMDLMTDRPRSSLWLVDTAGGGHRPLAGGEGNVSAPRWSPDGGRLAWIASGEGSAQLAVRWMEAGSTAVVTQLTEPPADLAWSPDGSQLAFTMRVPEEPEPFVKLPRPPEGAEWAPPPRVVDRIRYRADGQGWVPRGYRHVFVVPAEGGTPRQLTSGSFHHEGPLSWTPDGTRIVLSANRSAEWELQPLESEIHVVRVSDGRIETLTDRRGPDHSPAVSPDGTLVAYLGFDDREQGYQRDRLYVMGLDGSGRRELAASLDRSLERPTWSADGAGLFVQYDERGDTRIARIGLDGAVEAVADGVGGLSLGRPYSGGSFSVARDGSVAYTAVTPTRPADVAVARAGQPPRRLTGLNEDLLGQRALGAVEELVVESSFDGREIQAWVVKPPGFEAGRRYPLLLEIHGGPFANYGARFAAEVQLYASAGYVVVYANPRGSTSYGEEFGNLIHHAYPGNDYDDLMSVVDAVLSRGYADPERLYVTGGSGGGVLTAWIVGKTDRFRAAVVAKPVINWTSFVLHSDGIGFFYRYWFPGPPWEHAEEYRQRSPLSLVGHVTTPTMLLTGEEDWRTPISETEQYYAALKLRRVPTAMVRVPGSSHGIASRPSRLIAKVLHVLGWFARWGGPEPPTAS